LSWPAVVWLCLLGVATPVDGCIPFGLSSPGVASAKGAVHFASRRASHLLHLISGAVAPVLVAMASDGWRVVDYYYGQAVGKLQAESMMSTAVSLFPQ
jgi:hypothetical protein